LKLLDNCPPCEKKKFSYLWETKVENKTFKILKCKNCALIFVNPIPSINKLSKYYNEKYSVQKWQVNKMVFLSKSDKFIRFASIIKTNS